MKLIAIILLMGHGELAMCQADSAGVYLIIKCSKDSRKIVRANNKPICIPPKPVLTIDDFESVTELLPAPNRNLGYFNLLLTPNGTQKLTALLSTFPETPLALVVNQKVATFSAGQLEKPFYRSLQIFGNQKTGEIFIIHSALKSMLPNKSVKP